MIVNNPLSAVAKAITLMIKAMMGAVRMVIVVVRIPVVIVKVGIVVISMTLSERNMPRSVDSVASTESIMASMVWRFVVVVVSWNRAVMSR